MNQESRRLVLIALPIVLVAGLGVWLAGQGAFGPRFATSSPAPTANAGRSVAPRALVASDSPTISAPDAEVVLVEFLDFECEACGAAFPTVKRILDEYEGRLTYVVRDFPNHNNSILAASAAYAADEQGKYWEMYDLLFERQTTWAERREPQGDAFIGFGRELGLDMDRFRADLESGRYVDRIRRDFEDARALGVDATPTFFINDVKHVGVPRYEDLKRLIDEAIASGT